MANINNGLTPAQLNVPTGYSVNPIPGRLEQLYSSNNRDLYSRLSPYSKGTGIYSFGPKQPFLYKTPNSIKKGITKFKKFDSQAFPFISSALDTIRVSKFLVTGNGILFTAKQFLLQKNQAYNETRIYNPLMPILAVSTKINPFSEKNPSRFIDRGSIASVFKSLVGLPTSNSNPPPGTVGIGALTAQNKGNSKGLLRADTATLGYNRLTNKSPQKAGLLDAFKSLPKTLFGGFGTPKQPTNASYRADEGAYGIQLSAQNKFDYFDKNGSLVKWGKDYFMRFEAGSQNGNAKEKIRKSSETSIVDSKKIIKFNGKTLKQNSQYFSQRIGTERKVNKGYTKYEDVVFKNLEEPYFSSDILSIYVEYISDDTKNYPTKFSEKSDEAVVKIEAGLKKIISDIESAGYSFKPNNSKDVFVKQFSNGQWRGMGEINRLTKDPNSKGSSAGNYTNSYERENRDNPHHIDKVKGFAGSYRHDRVNALTILYKDSNDESSTRFKDYNGETFIPHTQDQVAFYFHDLVNDNYIPFRNTVTGINEGLSANWSDVTYIGRADKLVNYTGFTRTLSFNFTVVAMSLKELYPMWQRINYFSTLVKPSGYVNDRFIIPPMTTLTLGDMYVSQPFIIKSIGISIPDDAAWETISEINPSDVDWKYLNEKITFKGSGKDGMYAQFPRECKLSVSGDLLEKDAPSIGKLNWGRDGGRFSENLAINNRI